MIPEKKIDFFIVGAARCGTTSLYNYLKSNEQIFLPNVKETNFFSEVSSHRREDYELPKEDEFYHTKIIKSVEVYNALYKKAEKDQIKGDISPSYLWDLDAARRIYNYNPKAKVIISLRHPVDRAFSHYIMNYYTGSDKTETFSEAIKATKNLKWSSCNQYLEMGLYYKQVKAYFDLFKREQIKVLVYEDWITNTEEELKKVFEFLDLETTAKVVPKNVETNKIKPIRNLTLLNFLRQNSIRRVLKLFLSDRTIEKVKSNVFYADKEIEALDNELKNNLSKSFSKDVKELSELTQIDFIDKWKLN